MKTTRIEIEGMSCEGCVASTQRALQNVDGVRAVNVDLAAGQATIEHEDHVTPKVLLAAVTDAGYDAQIEAS